MFFVLAFKKKNKNSLYLNFSCCIYNKKIMTKYNQAQKLNCAESESECVKHCLKVIVLLKLCPHWSTSRFSMNHWLDCALFIMITNVHKAFLALAEIHLVLSRNSSSLVHELIILKCCWEMDHFSRVEAKSGKGLNDLIPD